MNCVGSYISEQTYFRKFAVKQCSSLLLHVLFFKVQNFKIRLCVGHESFRKIVQSKKYINMYLSRYFQFWVPNQLIKLQSSMMAEKSEIPIGDWLYAELIDMT